MAFATKQVVDQVTPITCEGTLRLWARGSGVISGTTKIDNVASACRVFLHTADGTLRGYRRTAADGLYSFLGLPPGEYRLVIEDDRQGTRRSKVEHVVVT